MAGGPVALRRGDEDNPNAITLTPAASTATQTLTLPAALPGASAFVTIDSSGDFGYTPALSQGITRAMQAAVGQQLSASSGTFTGTAITPGESVTNLNVTITTTGRPIVIMLVPDDSGNTSSVRFRNTTESASLNLWFAITGDATATISLISLSTGAVAGPSGWAMWSPSCMSTVYAPAAGTYTITTKIQLNGTGTAYAVLYAKLLAYEI
jgi:hypothetical protein